MSKKINIKEILIPTLSLLIICIVITTALAGTNLLTKQKIDELQLQTQKEAMQSIIKADSYIEKALTYEDVNYTYYEAVDSEVRGYIFITTGKGYGGDISVMTGILNSGEIATVEILDVSGETPGLGQNATQPDFYEQYIGTYGDLSVVKSGAGDEEINAITGATITSNAVTQAVNLAYRIFEKAVRG